MCGAIAVTIIAGYAHSANKLAITTEDQYMGVTTAIAADPNITIRGNLNTMV